MRASDMSHISEIFTIGIFPSNVILTPIFFSLLVVPLKRQVSSVSSSYIFFCFFVRHRVRRFDVDILLCSFTFEKLFFFYVYHTSSSSSSHHTTMYTMIVSCFILISGFAITLFVTIASLFCFLFVDITRLFFFIYLFYFRILLFSHSKHAPLTCLQRKIIWISFRVWHFYSISLISQGFFFSILVTYFYLPIHFRSP